MSPLYEMSLNLHFHLCGSRAREDPAASPGWECLSSHPCRGVDVLEDLPGPYSTVVPGRAGWCCAGVTHHSLLSFSLGVLCVQSEQGRPELVNSVSLE